MFRLGFAKDMATSSLIMDMGREKESLLIALSSSGRGAGVAEA